MKRLLYNLVKIFNPILSNSLYANLLFMVNCIRLGKSFYILNIKTPTTFIEHINYIKFNNRNPLAPIVADKYAVREYVKNKIGEEYLIPLITTYNDPEEIELNLFKEDCILKMNNGSGGNLVYNVGSNLNNSDAKSFFRDSYKTNMHLYNREWHYKLIKPKIVVEELIGDDPNDYKFFCNEEGPFAIQVDVDRFTNHTRNLYDLDWNLLPQKLCYDNSKKDIPQPENFEKMKNIAKILSKDFTFSRIDLYDIGDKVWFGEITLHPEGGAGPFDSKKSDLIFGQNLSLKSNQ